MPVPAPADRPVAPARRRRRRRPYFSVAALVAVAFGCAAVAQAVAPPQPPAPTADTPTGDTPATGTPAADTPAGETSATVEPAAPAVEGDAAGTQDGLASATFAGGCFWCMEPPFDKLEGVVSTTSGYTAGRLKDPTYEQVSAGRTGHAESLKVVYDPKKIDYDTLLKVFWRNVDPLRKNAQFCDKGNQYRSAIFYHSEEQKAAAEASLKEVEARFEGRTIATQVVPAEPFYDAEEYHQDYYLKNPLRYKYYRFSCGRDQRLQELWGEEAGAVQIIKEHAKPAAAATPTAG